MAGDVPAPVAPTAPVAPPKAVETTPTESPPPSEPAKDWAKEYRRLEAEHAKKVREHIIERRKWDADRKTTGERLSRLSELEKREGLARLNPTEFAKSVWGDDWHEKLTEAKVHGVPPADLVAAEMNKLRDEFEAKLSSREAAEKQSREQAQREQLDHARASMRADATDWLRENASAYPILERLGDATKVAKRIADRIEHEFHRSTQRDESGRVVRQGRVLTTQEAAELIEGDLVAIAEHALGAEKYRARLGEKLKPLSAAPAPATVPGQTSPQQSEPKQSTGQQPRKTLTNDIGARTTGESKPLTPAERRERALAAFEAARRTQRGA